MEQPIYQKIMNQLRYEINQMTPNSAILSERELADKFSASRMTVRKAVRKLVEEGYLYRKENVGTFVADQKLHKKTTAKAALESFDTEIDYKILYFDVKNNDQEVAQHLEIHQTDQFIRIVRLNMKEGQPESVDQIHIVRLMVDDKMMNDIKSLLSFSASIETGSVNQTFVPIIVPVQFANLLKLKLNTPIIRVDSRLITKGGRVFAYIQTFLNPQVKQLEITI